MASYGTRLVKVRCIRQRKAGVVSTTQNQQIRSRVVSNKACAVRFPTHQANHQRGAQLVDPVTAPTDSCCPRMASDGSGDGVRGTLGLHLVEQQAVELSRQSNHTGRLKAVVTKIAFLGSLPQPTPSLQSVFRDGLRRNRHDRRAEPRGPGDTRNRAGL